MTFSNRYINNGSPKEFIESLKKEVANHSCLNHVYLKKLNNGSFENNEAVLRDWAHQYSFYSANFTDYIKSIIINTNDKNIINPLQENLDEELGDMNSNYKPHVELFTEFKRGIGIDEEYEKKNKASITVKLWRDLFSQKCKSKNIAVAIGAIGIGTEYIVPTIYPSIINCIEKHTTFDKSLSFFFRLHVECDAEHAEETIKVAEYLAENYENREAIKFGVISSLNLRNAFWENQLSRSTKK